MGMLDMKRTEDLWKHFRGILAMSVEIWRERRLKEFLWGFRSGEERKISQSNCWFRGEWGGRESAGTFEKNLESVVVIAQFLGFNGPNGNSTLRFCFVVSSIRI